MYFLFKYFIQHTGMQTINKNGCILHSKTVLFKLEVMTHHHVTICSLLGYHCHSFCPCHLFHLLEVLCIYHHTFLSSEVLWVSHQGQGYYTHWGQQPVFLELPRLWGQLPLPELSHYTCDYSALAIIGVEWRLMHCQCLICEFGLLTFKNEENGASLAVHLVSK